MNDEVRGYLEKHDEQTKKRFHAIYGLVYENTSQKICEILWAKLPSFYVENKFIRIIAFKDHVNIEAKAVLLHKDELFEYKITPKGMLQIFHNQQIPNELLKVIFKESLE